MRAFLACALVIGLCAVGAQAQVKVEMQVNGELGFPVSPEAFTDGWSSVGFGAGAGIGVELLPVVTVLANFSYTQVGLDEDGIKQQLLEFGLTPEDLAGVSLDGGAVSILYLSGGGKVYLSEGGRTRFYVVAGLGFYRLSASDIDIRQDGSQIGAVSFDAENAFGVNSGAGIDFTIRESVKMFVEGQYVVGFTEGDSTAHAPVRVGLRFALGG